MPGQTHTKEEANLERQVTIPHQHGKGGGEEETQTVDSLHGGKDRGKIPTIHKATEPRTEPSEETDTRGETQVGYEAALATQAKRLPNLFWRYMYAKDGISDLIIEGESDAQGNPKLTQNDQEKAEVLANFFSTVYTREPEGPLPVMHIWPREMSQLSLYRER